MSSSSLTPMIFTSYGRQFHLSVISSESDQAEVFAFMQSQFRINEPITNAIRCSAQDTYLFYQDICSECFKHKFSLIARDNQGQMAGIVLNSIWENSENMKNGLKLANLLDKGCKEFGQAIRNGPYQSLNANRLAVFLDFVEADIASLFPVSAFKLDILAVHPMFSRMGLASYLIEKTIQIARFACFNQIVTSATAVASQNLFRKFGFQTVRRVQFDDFLEDGRAVYRNLHDTGTGAELMVIK